jgi:hypothetical protein
MKHEYLVGTKRRYVLEMIDYMTETQNWFTPKICQESFKMIEKNLFNRSIRWESLQFIYKFILHFLITSQSSMDVMKSYLSQNFLFKFINLFDSKNAFERGYLRIILNVLYNEFAFVRPIIEKGISNILFQVIYENDDHHGIIQLLQVIDEAIIPKFTSPLKEEQQKFLCNVLIPLHKVKTFHKFDKELIGCIKECIQKDPDFTTTVVLGAMLKFWPQTSSRKEILFYSELNQILPLVSGQHLTQILMPLVKQICKGIQSCHAKVALNALRLFYNLSFMQAIMLRWNEIICVVYPSLQCNFNHWNKDVLLLRSDIVNIIKKVEDKLFKEGQIQTLIRSPIKNPRHQENARRIKWGKVYALI